MVIPLLLSSLFCKRPSQDEVRIFINSIGLLLILLSSYNRLAALGLVLSIIAISYPRDGGHNRKKKVNIAINHWGKKKRNVFIRSIFRFMKIHCWLLMSCEGKSFIQMPEICDNLRYLQALSEAGG